MLWEGLEKRFRAVYAHPSKLKKKGDNIRQRWKKEGELHVYKDPLKKKKKRVPCVYTTSN